MKNQNDIRLRGITAFNPLAEYTSSSRGQMQSNAVSQAVVISGAEPNMIQSGAEIEYGKYTNAIIAPHNMKVIAVVPRYTPSQYNGIQFNPETIVIYQTFDNGGRTPLFGMIDVTKHVSNHPKFGFEYKPTEHASQLRVGHTIPKDTVLYDSPNKDSIGNYSKGINLNTLFSSVEGTGEDSILIAKDVIPKLKMKTVVTRQMELGTTEFPLNLYGDDENYKIMPEIGEYCIPTGEAYSGIIMAKREYRPELLPITFTKRTTRIFDSITDTPLDGDGQEARVVDIIVYRQNKTTTAVAPRVLQQLNKYADAYQDFCERVLKEYRKIMAEYNNQAQFTDDFDQLIKHCMAITSEPTLDTKSRNIPIQKVGNFNRKLDDYTIIVTTEYIKDVGPGFKVTNLHGGKGVIADVVEVDPEKMPFDPVTGVRADIIIPTESPFNRMNLGAVYEQTIKAAMVELKDWVEYTTGFNKDTPNLKEQVARLNPTLMDEVLEHVGNFYTICSSGHEDIWNSWSRQERIIDIYHIIKDKPYLFLPHGNERRLLDVFKTLKEEGYLSNPNRLMYYNEHTGEMEETVTPQRIGPMYFICLEKTGDDIAAVSTAATQPNGIIVPLTSKDKATQQTRLQATKFPGESEYRIFLGATPTGTAAEIHDRSNNPVTVEAMLNKIYDTDRPTDIDVIVDRDEIPLGANRPLQILRHYLQCNGIEMVYNKFDPSLQERSTLDPVTGKPIIDIEDDLEKEDDSDSDDEDVNEVEENKKARSKKDEEDGFESDDE